VLKRTFAKLAVIAEQETEMKMDCISIVRLEPEIIGKMAQRIF
jgi:hypothetical protein